MQMCQLWRILTLGLVLTAVSQATLIEFTGRTQFAASTTLAPGLPDAQGVDFMDSSVCPTSISSASVIGCAPSGSFSEWGSSANPRVVNFGLSGFSVEGYFGGTTNTTRLVLFSANYVQPVRGADAFNVPYMMSRNLSDNANSGALKVRINVPSNTTSFAIDLSNACNVNSAVSGCDYTDNQLGTIRVTTSRGDTKIVNIPDNLSTGEFATFAATSDQTISWIELSLPTLNQLGLNNIGAIAFTNVAFGEAVPEPGTWMLVAIGIALLLVSRRSSIV